MTNMSIRSQLEVNTFTHGNKYHLQGGKILDFVFTKHTPILPVILGRSFVAARRYSIEYSTYSYQFKGRIISTAKLVEIMDSCPHPILVKMIGDNYYLVGKGFLARSDSEGNFIELLYVAFVPYDNTNQSYILDKVKIYICRSIYKEENNRILPAMKQVMDNFKGEMMLTNDIEQYMGSKIKIPSLRTLDAVNHYKRQLIGFCLQKTAERLSIS